MSSLGRPSFSIDLTTTTMSAVNLLNNRMDVLELNVGEPSIPEQKDENDIIIFEQQLATGLNLDVENLQANLGTASTDDNEATGLHLDVESNTTRIEHLEIPTFSEALDYYVLMDHKEEHGDNTINTANTIKINNEEKKDIHTILKEVLLQTEINKRNNDIQNQMIKQTGFGLGHTTIVAPPTAKIQFNTRILASTLSDMIPALDSIKEDEAVAVYIANWISSLGGTLSEETQQWTSLNFTSTRPYTSS